MRPRTSPTNTPMFRVQAKELPMTPHESPYFDQYVHLGEDGRMLPPGKYEALYVSPDKKALEELRRKQGYFQFSVGAEAYVIVRPKRPVP